MADETLKRVVDRPSTVFGLHHQLLGMKKFDPTLIWKDALGTERQTFAAGLPLPLSELESLFAQVDAILGVGKARKSKNGTARSLTSDDSDTYEFLNQVINWSSYEIPDGKSDAKGKIVLPVIVAVHLAKDVMPSALNKKVCSLAVLLSDEPRTNSASLFQNDDYCLFTSAVRLLVHQTLGDVPPSSTTLWDLVDTPRDSKHRLIKKAWRRVRKLDIEELRQGVQVFGEKTARVGETMKGLEIHMGKLIEHLLPRGDVDFHFNPALQPAMKAFVAAVGQQLEESFGKQAAKHFKTKLEDDVSIRSSKLFPPLEILTRSFFFLFRTLSSSVDSPPSRKTDLRTTGWISM